MPAGSNESKDGTRRPDRSAWHKGSAWSETPTQPWSFALFALVTTASIVGVALSAPFAIEVLATHLSAVLNAADPNTGLGSEQPLFSRSTLTWAGLLGFQAAVIVLAVIMASVAPGTGPSFFWQPPERRYSWVVPLAVTVTVSAVIAALGFTFFPDQIAKDLAPIRGLIDGGPLWMAFLALTVGAPLSEELLFRGYLLNRLRQTQLGFWGAALIANIGWTALHVGYSWLSLADVFIAGLLFSWALWRTRSIWIPILFHAAYNAIVFVILLIPKTSAALALAQ